MTIKIKHMAYTRHTLLLATFLIMVLYSFTITIQVANAQTYPKNHHVSQAIIGD